MQARVAQVAVDWHSGLPTHAIQTVQLNIGRAPKLPMWTPARVPEPPQDAMSRDEAWAACKGTIADREADLSSTDVDTYFAAFERVLQEYHSARTGQQQDLVGRRGSITWKRREPRAHEGQAETVASAKLGRRWRRLRGLAMLWPVAGPLPQHADGLIRALRNTEDWGSPWRDRLIHCSTSAPKS